SPIRTRNDFGSLLNHMGLLGEAVEVGVHRGQFAEILLKQWRGKRPWGIGTYTRHHDPNAPAANSDRSKDRKSALKNTNPFGERFQLIEQPSVQAAGQFRDGTLDFANIDACHQYPDVAADIKAWWPKVRPGGILAGHDVLAPGYSADQ